MEISGGWLTVNRACNMRCPWCYASTTEYDKDATMPLTLAKQLIDLFGDLGAKNIIILGGEPTIYPHLTKVIKYAIARGIKPVIVTNGKRLSDYSYTKSLREAGLKELTISLKAVEAEEYQSLSYKRETGLFENICAGIRNVQNLDLGLNISITIVRSFLGRFNELVDLLVKLNPTHITIDMGTPIITPDGMNATGILNPTELSEALTTLYIILKKTSLNYSFNISIPLCILNETVRRDIISEGKVLTTCHVAKGKGLVFTPEGFVIPCNHFAPFPVGQFGVDFHNSEEFKTFWKGKDMSAIRARASTYPHERCQCCSDWNICGGGCMVKWLYWDPKSFIPIRTEGI